MSTISVIGSGMTTVIVIAAISKPDIAFNTVSKELKNPLAEVSETKYGKLTSINSIITFFFLKETGKKLNYNGKICTIITSLLGPFASFYTTYAGT